MSRILTVVVLVCGASLVACSLGRDDGVVADSDMSLEVSNGTTIEVTLAVNGVLIDMIARTSFIKVEAANLPPLPWTAKVLSPSGRVLVALDVHSGDVRRYGNGSRGDAQRVDLSCGRIDIWSGPPLGGPMPLPGVPGDCN